VEGWQEFNKEEWIDKAIGTVGDERLLADAVARLTGLVSALGGITKCLQTNSRFITGLGREHPVENGLAWHHTLGVPYLPGSSVKGVVRAWAEKWALEDPADIKRILGGIQEKSVGSVEFFDAIPTSGVKLEREVMTPHYAPYYQNAQPPVDWYAPTPIPFLALAAGQPFLFAIAAKKPSGAADVQKAMAWLIEALEWIGAGAKTAVGYGRFVECSVITLPQHDRRGSAANLVAKGRVPDLLGTIGEQLVQHGYKPSSEGNGLADTQTSFLLDQRPNQRKTVILQEGSIIWGELVRKETRHVVFRLEDGQEVEYWQYGYPKKAGEKVRLRVVKMAGAKVKEIRPV
ncbi:MAG: type III-B CRISPR module RAMP protein Cmr6, partial [Candidatus Methanomethyliaceae archaeon]